MSSVRPCCLIRDARSGYQTGTAVRHITNGIYRTSAGAGRRSRTIKYGNQYPAVRNLHASASAPAWLGPAGASSPASLRGAGLGAEGVSVLRARGWPLPGTPRWRPRSGQAACQCRMLATTRQAPGRPGNLRERARRPGTPTVWGPDLVGERSACWRRCLRSLARVIGLAQ